MKLFKESEGYKTCMYMVMIDNNYTEYDTLQLVYDDFKIDYTNDSKLRFFVGHYSSINASFIYEQVNGVTSVSRLQTHCKILKCE